MPTFNIYTLGCKANQYDSNVLKKRIISSVLEYKKKNADIVIINTCSVTESAISKNKRMVNKARKENPAAKIILFGCWPKVYGVKAEDLGVDAVFKTGEENKLIKKIQGISSKEIAASSRCAVGLPAMADNKSRYFMKIQDGCEQYCAYCVIPYARGKLKSRSAREVVKEAEEAIKAGFREIVLTGIHLGLYGKDLGKDKKFCLPTSNLKTGINLVYLLKRLLEIKDLGRIRLSSIEITEVSDELINLMAESGKICRHLHISLQSSCDKILKRMNRPYDSEYFKKRIVKIRKAMPDIAITTDVIVGFPGETATDFKETYNFCEKLAFSKIHVFPFSAHEKTPAAKMGGKVEKGEIAARSAKLRKLSEKLEKDYKNKFKGRELWVVVGTKSRAGKLVGKSEYYFDVKFKASARVKMLEQKIIGHIIKVKSWDF